MKIIFSIILILLPVVCVSSADYNKIDKQSATIPATLKTVPEITAYLTRNLSTTEEKVRAIYYWISHNIRYDVSQLKNVDISYSYGERNLLHEVLQNRQGVCQHYAELFQACCQAAGIQSYVIKGYTKLNNDIAPLSHAWNAVVINGKYYEIDATWAAGYVDKGKFTQEFKDLYFMVPPAEFIKTHIAFDPVWQFLDNPISHKEFLVDDFSKLKMHFTFNYTDSIKTIAGLDSLTALICETRRISNSGLTNDLLRKHVYRNQQNIVQLKYNSAVSDFNKGVEAYNIYVMNKNKQFNGTSMEEEKILELLSSARKHSETAAKGIKFLNADNPVISKNISDLQNTIGKLIQDIDSEDAFMKKYIKTWKPLRMFLFVR